MGIWDELAEKIPDQGYKTQLLDLIKKPALSGVVAEVESGYLRQTDYSRKQDELKNADQLVKQWEQWRTANWDNASNKTKAQIEAEQKAEELRKQVETLSTQVRTLEAMGGEDGDVDWNKLNETITETIKQQGVVTRQELPEVLKAALPGNLVDEDKYRTLTTQAMNDMSIAFSQSYASMRDIEERHRETFGKALNVPDYFKFIQDNKLHGATYDDAYQRFVAKDLEAKQKTDLEAQIQKAREEERAKTLTEMAQGANGRMPVDTEGAGIATVGHLQARIQQGAAPNPNDPNPALALAGDPMSDIGARQAAEAYLKSRAASH